MFSAFSYCLSRFVPECTAKKAQCWVLSGTQGHLNDCPCLRGAGPAQTGHDPNPCKGGSREGSEARDGVFRMREIGAIQGKTLVTGQEVARGLPEKEVVCEGEGSRRPQVDS